jgi:hypothetical protein
VKETANPQLKLQQLLDCYLESGPQEVLRQWADAGWKADTSIDTDETCLKYLALVLLDSIESRASRTVLEMGCPALVDCGRERHMLPAAPESLLARGLELLRGMCGLDGGTGSAVLFLGIRDSSLEIHIHKSEALHILQFSDFLQ